MVTTATSKFLTEFFCEANLLIPNSRQRTVQIPSSANCYHVVFHKRLFLDTEQKQGALCSALHHTLK